MIALVNTSGRDLPAALPEAWSRHSGGSGLPALSGKRRIETFVEA
jgi:hypothetical protein